MYNNLKEKIEPLEKKHHVIEDNLIDAIWVLDVETLKFDYITQSNERIGGYTADEYMNFTMQEWLTPGSFQKLAAILAEEIPRFEQGIKVIRTLEVELIHKNGNIFWAELKVRFLKVAGKPLKIIGATREITEQKKAAQQQNELIQLIQKLGEASACKEKLLKEINALKSLLPYTVDAKEYMMRTENSGL